MSPLIQNIIILFILTLIVGFIIGYFLRNKARKNNYITQINELNEKHDETEYFFNNSLKKDKDIQNRYDSTLEIYQTQKNLLQEQESTLLDLERKETKLTQDEKNILAKIQDTSQQIQNQEEEIKTLSAKLDKINEGKTNLKEDEAKISSLQTELKEKRKEIDTYEDKIHSIKNQRHSIKIETEQLQQKYQQQRKSLDEIEKRIFQIEAKYSKELTNLKELNETLKITAINYEYALKEHSKPSPKPIHEDAGIIKHIFALPKTQKNEIDFLVRKNDQTRFIDKILRKIFKKPNLHIEEL